MKKLIIVALIATSLPVLAQNPASFSKLTCPDISIPAGSTTTALHLRNIGGHLFWGTQRIDTIPDAFAGNETDPIWVHDSADYLKKAVAEAAYAKKDSVPWVHHKYNTIKGVTYLRYPNDTLCIPSKITSRSDYVSSLIKNKGLSFPYWNCNYIQTIANAWYGSQLKYKTHSGGMFHDTSTVWFYVGSDYSEDQGELAYNDFGRSGASIKIRYVPVSGTYGNPIATDTIYSQYNFDIYGFYRSSYSTNPAYLGLSTNFWSGIFSSKYYADGLSFVSPTSKRIIVWDTTDSQFKKAVYPDPTNGNIAFGWGNHAAMNYLTGLSTGTYSVSVTGSSGNCTGNAATATTALGLSAGTYSVSVTGSSGSCTGNAATATTALGLSAGTYSVSVTGSSGGCTGNAATATTALGLSSGTYSVSVTGSSGNCTGNAATATTALGLSAGTYSVSVTGSSGSCTGNAATATTALGLSTGTYSVSVTGSSGSCTGNASSVTNGTYKTDIITLGGGGIDSTQISTNGFNKIPVSYSSGMVIDTLIFIGCGASINVTFKVYYGTNISASGTAIVTAGTAITSVSTVTKVSGASLNNTTITAGNIIWFAPTSITTIPRRVILILKGHRT